jgi:hypothetical protein
MGFLGRDVCPGSEVELARANLRLCHAVPGGVKGHSVVDSLEQKRYSTRSSQRFGIC